MISLSFLLPSLSSFVDPGPYGTGRYAEHMLPEVEEKYFRKASQVFHIILNLNRHFKLIHLFAKDKFLLGKQEVSKCHKKTYSSGCFSYLSHEGSSLI